MREEVGSAASHRTFPGVPKSYLYLQLGKEARRHTMQTPVAVYPCGTGSAWDGRRSVFPRSFCHHVCPQLGATPELGCATIRVNSQRIRAPASPLFAEIPLRYLSAAYRAFLCKRCGLKLEVLTASEGLDRCFGRVLEKCHEAWMLQENEPSECSSEPRCTQVVAVLLPFPGGPICLFARQVVGFLIP